MTSLSVFIRCLGFVSIELSSILISSGSSYIVQFRSTSSPAMFAISLGCFSEISSSSLLYFPGWTFVLIWAKRNNVPEFDSFKWLFFVLNLDFEKKLTLSVIWASWWFWKKLYSTNFTRCIFSTLIAKLLSPLNCNKKEIFCRERAISSSISQVSLAKKRVCIAIKRMTKQLSVHRKILTLNLQIYRIQCIFCIRIDIAEIATGVGDFCPPEKQNICILKNM